MLQELPETTAKPQLPETYSYFLLDSRTLIHFRWMHLKLSLAQHNNHKTHLRKINWVLTYQHTRELEVTKLVSNLRIIGKLSLIQ